MRQQLVRQRSERGDGHILELVSDHRAVVGKAGQRLGIVPGGASETATDFGCDRFGLGRINMGPVAQLGGGHGDHPAKLAAPEDTDGFAGRDHRTYEGRCATPSLCAAR